MKRGLLDFELQTKDARWFVWMNRHGFGFRLGRFEIQVYVYGSPVAKDVRDKFGGETR